MHAAHVVISIQCAFHRVQSGTVWDFLHPFCHRGPGLPIQTLVYCKSRARTECTLYLGLGQAASPPGLTTTVLCPRGGLFSSSTKTQRSVSGYPLLHRELRHTDGFARARNRGTLPGRQPGSWVNGNLVRTQSLTDIVRFLLPSDRFFLQGCLKSLESLRPDRPFIRSFDKHMIVSPGRRAGFLHTGLAPSRRPRSRVGPRRHGRS